MVQEGRSWNSYKRVMDLMGFSVEAPAPRGCSLPEEAHVPDGLVLQLRPEQGVGLGQDGDEPEEVAAHGGGDQHRDDHPGARLPLRPAVRLPGRAPPPVRYLGTLRSSLMSHSAMLSKAREPDWCVAATGVGT